MQQGNVLRSLVGNQVLIGVAFAAFLYIDMAVFLNQSALAQHHGVARKPAARPAPGNSKAMEGYLGRLRVRLINNWTVPDGKNVVILEAVVDPSGTATDVSTAHSKADSVALDSATIAFEKSQPLEHFPAGSNAPGKLTVTFTSTADPHGDSNSSVSLRIDPIPVAKGAAPQAGNTQPQENAASQAGNSQPQETAAPQSGNSQPQETSAPTTNTESNPETK
jgi:hypothetical protein